MSVKLRMTLWITLMVLLLAAMVLVTHNISDFEQFKEKSFLRLEDWFTA